MDSLRIDSLTKGCAVALVAVSAACSSTSTPPDQTQNSSSGGSSGNGSSSGSGSSGGGSSGGSSGSLNGSKFGPATMGTPGQTVAGTGEACTSLMNSKTFVMATKVILDVSWPNAGAIVGCKADASPPCTYQMTLLTTYTVNGNNLTSVSRSCGSQSPATTYNGIGNIAAGVPMGQTGEVQVTIPDATWDKPDMPKSAGTATVGGWNVGGSITAPGTVTLTGFKMGKTLGLENVTMPWPAKTSDLGLMTGDYADNDDDMKPGISVFPKSMAPFYLPHASSDPTSSALDQLYIASRQWLALYGTAKSCTEFTGVVYEAVLNTHIVGCHEQGGTDCPTNDSSNGSLFIDENNTVYSPYSGQFDSVELTMANPTCADARAATFPSISSP